MELRKDWNFRNDIAIDLEKKATLIYKNFEKIELLRNSIFSADNISAYSFVEVMSIVLISRTNFKDEQDLINNFIKKAYLYAGKSSYEIDPHNAQSLYDEFIKIYNSLNIPPAKAKAVRRPF